MTRKKLICLPKQWNELTDLKGRELNPVEWDVGDRSGLQRKKKYRRQAEEKGQRQSRPQIEQDGADR